MLPLTVLKYEANKREENVLNIDTYNFSGEIFKKYEKKSWDLLAVCWYLCG